MMQAPVFDLRNICIFDLICGLVIFSFTPGENMFSLESPQSPKKNILILEKLILLN